MVTCLVTPQSAFKQALATYAMRSLMKLCSHKYVHLCSLGTTLKLVNQIPEETHFYLKLALCMQLYSSRCRKCSKLE